MRKLSLTLLAASTMLIAGVATAQPGPGPRPGATWRGGGNVQMHAPNMQMRGPNVQMRGPNMQMRGGNFQVRGQRHGQMRGGHNFGFHRWGPHPGRNFRHSRLRRGFVINPFWFGPQFHVNNWQVYGFASPGPDQRWVRYYDDAYLIDGGGRVLDERYGVNWNGYGEEWGDEDGIPAYRGEWHDGDEDYADEEHGERREYHGGYQGGAMMPPPGYGPPPGHGGYTNVYGGGYGYGYYAYPIVIETVTTTSSGGYTEEIVEEYVETTRQRRRAHRPRRPRCSCARPAPRPAVRRPAPRPRPPAGERG